MAHYIFLLIGAVLVNNVVLVRILGLCPFLGVSKKLETALGMGAATTFVLTLGCGTSYIIDHYLLTPLDIGYLRTLAFIVVIAAIVQMTEMVLEKTMPVLHQVLGIYLPLITTNCAVLGLAILIGASLGYASLKFKVEGDPLVDKIDAILPQTQCGQCGFPGCKPYATAIASGEADINRCPPGGDDGIHKLADLLGREYKPLNAEAGVEKPKAVAFVDENTCIGCTLCLQACPVDAISGAAKQLHTIISSLCTGCELCVAPCPVDCISMQVVEETVDTWKWRYPTFQLKSVATRNAA